MAEIETRAFSDVGAVAQGRVVTWRPITFGTESALLGGGAFVETINSGSLTKTLRENRGIVGLFNHLPAMTLGTVRSGTLSLTEDATGVLARCQLPETRADVAELVARGDANSGSFSFEVVKEVFEARPGKVPLRRILEMKLFEVSLLSVAPAYPATEGTVSMRALEQARGIRNQSLEERRRTLEALADETGGGDFLRRLDRLTDAPTGTYSERSKFLQHAMIDAGIGPDDLEPKPRPRRFWFIEKFAR